MQIKHWLSPVVDPVIVLRGLFAYPRFFAEWRHYAASPDAERLRLTDIYPRLHERTSTTSIDTHYFYSNGWAMRRIMAKMPAQHVDIASQTMFINLLSAVLPVTFVDYRPLEAHMDGLTNHGGDILSLPFTDGSIESLSCLHVAEHIGLGRYGDPINPRGTYQAARELARVLALGGNLYFVLPVGKPRVCFNAHRIHASETIIEYFSDLEPVEFSGVHDDGRFVECVGLDEFKKSEYACGLFRFRKKYND